MKKNMRMMSFTLVSELGEKVDEKDGMRWSAGFPFPTVVGGEV